MTKTKTRFTHPALDAFDREKRALHGVLKAIDGLDRETKHAILSRAADAVIVEGTEAPSETDGA